MRVDVHTLDPRRPAYEGHPALDRGRALGRLVDSVERPHVERRAAVHAAACAAEVDHVLGAEPAAAGVPVSAPTRENGCTAAAAVSTMIESRRNMRIMLVPARSRGQRV
ncbi:hypothetical protein GCM10010411_48250 [Actinomadura fulvescens]|uniref:Uncharacterized protein n=1 Tax=Actinomadura fulvescens TaxID=46160 RepID=A0ABP6CEQ1_9ACTN